MPKDQSSHETAQQVATHNRVESALRDERALFASVLENLPLGVGVYDSDGNLVMTADVWWFMDHYESYCKANGIPINPELYL